MPPTHRDACANRHARTNGHSPADTNGYSRAHPHAHEHRNAGAADGDGYRSPGDDAPGTQSDTASAHGDDDALPFPCRHINANPHGDGNACPSDSD